MNSIIPKVLNNFNLYLGENGAEAAGTSTVELPELQGKTVELNVAGIAGTINVPLTGHFDAMQATVTADMPTEQFIKLATPEAQLITVRGAIEVQNTTRGKGEMHPITVVMRGSVSTNKHGKFERGAKMDASFSIEVDYYQVFLNNKELLEIDKFNNIYRVDGVDYLAPVRSMI
jgi:P2 family phage contractile tail tube protein